MQSDVMDVLIGVVFIWFMLSVMLAAVNEAFALATHLRAKHLWLGIGRLLDPAKAKLPLKFLDVTFRLPVQGKFDLRPVIPPSSPDPKDQTNPIVKHFAARPGSKADDDIKALRKATEALYARLAPQIVEIAKPGRLSKVTHIATAAIADGVVSLASNVHKQDLLAAARRLDWPEAKREKLDLALDNLDDDVRVSVADLANMATPDPLTADDWPILHDEAAKFLTPRDLVDALRANPAVASVGRWVGVATAEQLKDAKDAIGAQFEREMAQVSEFYRRQNRKILGVLALVTVVVLQANSVALALDLWHDSALRDSVVGGAVAAAGTTFEDAVSVPDCKEQPASSTAGAGAASTTTTTVDAVRQAKERLKCAGSIVTRAGSFHAGLGWTDFKQAHGVRTAEAKAEWSDVWPYLTARWGLVGRPITAIALLFGAQFWFDVLRRLVGLRKPGPPAPTPTPNA
jgi:hypothetical protein